MTRRILAIFVVLAGLAAAQRLQPVIDPETREGLLIQQIQQERDPAARIRLLESFSVQYPSHASAPWVYDQLFPAYLKEGNFARALVAGEILLGLFPDDLNYANGVLQAAVGKNDAAKLAQHAATAWDLAEKQMAGQENPPALAVNLRNYAEYCLFLLASQTADPKQRLAQFQALERRNPHTSYLPLIQVEYFQLYRKLGQMEKALAIAEKATTTGAGGEDMMVALLDYYFARGDSNERVAQLSAKLIDRLNARTNAPEHLSQEEWERRRATMLSNAYYMGGMANSLLGRYATADRYLRAALPALRNSGAQQAAVLYHLGLANYKLAENGEKGRVPEAIKYSELCASIPSTYQDQAAKNVIAIKAAYNIR